MAEFCLDCFNRLENCVYARCDVKLSLLRELCEGCGETRRVVVGLHRFATRQPAPPLDYRTAYRTLTHEVRALISRIEADDAARLEPLFLLSLLDDALEQSERDLYPSK